MLDFLASISESIVTVFTFLTSQLINLFSVLQMLVHGSTFLMSCIAFLPPLLVSFAATAVVISVIFLIIGR